MHIMKLINLRKESMFMMKENLEKRINKLDGDIEALRRAK